MAKSSRLTEDYRTSKGYIHGHVGSYRNYKMSVSEAMLQTTAAYRDAREYFKQKAGVNLGTKPETAMGIVSGISALLEKHIESLPAKSRVSPAKIDATQGKSFFGVSREIGIAKKASQLDKMVDKYVDNIDSLGEYLKALSKVVEDFANIRVDELMKIYAEVGDSNEEFEQVLREKGANMPSIDGKALSFFEVGPSFTATRNMLKSYVQLRKIHNKMEGGGKLDSSGKNLAVESMRKIGGQLINIGGSGRELTLEASLNNVNFFYQEEMKDLMKKINARGSGIVSKGTGSVKLEPGDVSNYQLLTRKRTTSKADVDLVFDIGRDSTSIEVNFGISLKQKEITSKFGSRTVKVLDGANLKDFLNRSKVLQTYLEYQLLNSMVYQGENNYQAIKMLAAVRGLLPALTGAMNRQDMAYILVFSNKVISMYDYLTEIERKGLNLSSVVFKGENTVSGLVRKKGYRVRDFQDPKKTPIQNGIDRSRVMRDHIYKTIKVRIDTPVPSKY